MSNNDYVFIKACFNQPVSYTPVWIMRQAGRYLKEYRQVREKVTFLQLCKTPELAAEVTLQPVNILGVDAAILFSDILIPLEPMGIKLHFNEGPVLENPINSTTDVEKLVVPDPVASVSFVFDTIKILRQELNGKVPLIGFTGAPFTLASYMIEGGSSSNFLKVKTFMFQQESAWHQLMIKVADTVSLYLKAQIEAGAQALQLFDSWGGVLSPYDYERYVLPYSQKVITEVKGKGVPIIHFVQGNPALLPLVAKAGSDVVGVDWRINIDEARKLVAKNQAVQGNLDPCALFLPPETLKERVADVITRAGRQGHIFNLGHGILPTTPVENAKLLVETVHNLTRSNTILAG